MSGLRFTRGELERMQAERDALAERVRVLERLLAKALEREAYIGGEWGDAARAVLSTPEDP